MENTDDDATGADVMRILLDAKADVSRKLLGAGAQIVR